MKYAWIQEHCDSFPIALMCDVLAVSRSGYYASVDRAPSPRAERRQRIDAAVRQVHAQSHGIYGSAKIAKELAESDKLESACRNTATSIVVQRSVFVVRLVGNCRPPVS